MVDIFYSIVEYIVHLSQKFGYVGIVATMFLESSFFPFPSEVIIIPAGYLAHKGEMNIYMVIFCGTLGSLLGAIFNYYLAVFLGRALLIKYGRYIFFTKEHLDKVEMFFDKYGSASTFIGRLLPGIRQYISLPAGLARMNMYNFCFFTTLGASIWVSILAIFGYLLGDNQELIKEYLHYILFGILILIALFIVYLYKKRAKN